ncbi:hypothetical protein DFJ74DRAFT_691180 [Hyaloraphidium curvatum]|nr:hypothetical protein DFJ74DRAFT_691180 [Hyaloraphidium curvatum]
MGVPGAWEPGTSAKNHALRVPIILDRLLAPQLRLGRRERGRDLGRRRAPLSAADSPCGIRQCAYWWSSGSSVGARRARLAPEESLRGALSRTTFPASRTSPGPSVPTTPRSAPCTRSRTPSVARSTSQRIPASARGTRPPPGWIPARRRVRAEMRQRRRAGPAGRQGADLRGCDGSRGARGSTGRARIRRSRWRPQS